MSDLTPLQMYQSRLADGALKPDPVQAQAVQELERLYDEIIQAQNKPKPSFLQIIAGLGKDDIPPIKGIYMHGGVGRGKSMLMDLFYDCLPDTIKKRRVHFHEFMIEVHDYIHSRKEDASDKGMVEQALPSLADLIIRRSRVLCFDEFHVTDITDAMILGRLFKILFEMDIIIVATSNWPPDRLYEGGLQRERFLPFIDLLKRRVQVMHLDSPHDYRKQHAPVEGTYFSPLGQDSSQAMDRVFAALTAGVAPESDVVKVKGRKISPSLYAAGVARFTFAQLCEKPLGAEDYITIAQRYDVLMLEDIPLLTFEKRNEAKRLMNLVDALYEARTRVIISAQARPENLYSGSDHAYEFERTISRLQEMQGKDWP